MQVWVKTTARCLGLESTLRPRGRPRVRPVQKIQNNESCLVVVQNSKTTSRSPGDLFLILFLCTRDRPHSYS